MSRRVFISHAGGNLVRAQEVASHLYKVGLTPLLDREHLKSGDSFLTFMETGLATSDYFLLLWSAQAAERQWVRLEWEAALYRSVMEARSFLTVGRLDQHPLPSLLAPRLTVPLHPGIEPGIDEFVRLCQDDQKIEQAEGKPVASNALLLHEPAGVPLYVSSELFGVTVPVQINLASPAGVVLLDLTERLSLPKSLSHQGQIGVRFEYRLLHEGHALDADTPLSNQAVKVGSVLKLECTMRPFAATAPVAGKLDALIFRGASSELRAIQAGKREMAARVAAVNLGAQAKKMVLDRL